ncbi:bactofilin family protein [Aestuariirhabdus litorea]|uniref:Polymer-forming cytoskeletal protein n=1 Tax=Aestuariirhabdus litorea TaxID=2528527 RepID=A0A3P3VNG2_9GAMM|nr:polymer-forming cytoskeletal protein [Aestuariirhabdus litorea]RRJ83458.1 polymer-forming cytoskeletal protein [Aestuariirhabdus litorea]RWW93619.1 polymer-forming cytoskeletal protein [Endozoicomonadaceae bacterium GTF-13]
MRRKVKPKAINIEKYGDRTTLIANGATVNGDLQFEGALQIEGRVIGNVTAAEGLVRIADNGYVEGEIRSPHIIINGKVTGDVHSSEHLELAAQAEVNGNVFYKLIEMVMGAQVNGSLEYSPEPQVASAPAARQEQERMEIAAEADPLL